MLKARQDRMQKPARMLQQSKASWSWRHEVSEGDGGETLPDTFIPFTALNQPGSFLIFLIRFQPPGTQTPKKGPASSSKLLLQQYLRLSKSKQTYHAEACALMA